MAIEIELLDVVDSGLENCFRLAANLLKVNPAANALVNIRKDNHNIRSLILNVIGDSTGTSWAHGTK